MRQKLFKKQFGAIALIVVLSLFSILIILTFIYNSYLAREKYNTLKKSCEAVDQFVVDSGNNTNVDATYYIMSNLAEVAECDVFITDRNCVIRICACEEWGLKRDCQHTGAQLDATEVNNATRGNKHKISTLGYYTKPYYAVATKFEFVDGYVVSASSLESAKNLMQTITKIYIVSAIVPLLLMFVAIFIMTYRLTKPLRLMSDAAKAMSRGDFSRRIPVTRDDEIGELAVSFNQMTNSLARLEETRKSFVANVSHELRTPMTTIGGFIDGIIDGTIPSDRQNHYLQIVHDEVKRLSRMVESMLSISRLESKENELKFEPFDFKEQVLQVVISQEQRIEQKNIEILGLDTLPDGEITADKDLIYRVIYNLVDNAVKFTNENGKIKFNVKVNNKNLFFRIENTGKGIPKNELPYVFERFYKLDKSRSANKESTGLGLYIVKTIIQKHGGTISVSSVEEQFAAFEFTLPLDRS